MIDRFFAWIDTAAVPVWLILVLGAAYGLISWLVIEARRGRRPRPPVKDFDAWKRGR